MAISLVDARSQFTKTLIAVLKTRPRSTSFLRSFFVPKHSMSKEISIEVQLGSEKVAVDVKRYSDGNYNKFDRSSEKIIVPPFYDEWLAANNHRLYDIAIANNGSATAFAALANELADAVDDLMQKIERSYEVQCAQVLETGVVQLANYTNIDFQRKAASLVDLMTGNYFNNNSVNPYTALEAGGDWVRKNSKTNTGTFDLLFGSKALSEFMNNSIVKDRADIRNFSLDRLSTPQRNATGGVLHGEISFGAYTARIWSYAEYYEDANGTQQPYLNPRKVVMLPEMPHFVLATAAVPQLIDAAGNVPQTGPYLVQDFIDDKKATHEYHVKSAGVAVPVHVNQIYTLTAASA